MAAPCANAIERAAQIKASHPAPACAAKSSSLSIVRAVSEDTRFAVAPLRSAYRRERLYAAKLPTSLGFRSRQLIEELLSLPAPEEVLAAPSGLAAALSELRQHPRCGGPAMAGVSEFIAWTPGGNTWTAPDMEAEFAINKSRSTGVVRAELSVKKRWPANSR